MGRIVSYALILGAVGLVLGYLIFGRIGGQYVNLSDLFRPANNVLQDAFQSIAGLKQARQNVLISGAVGLAAGAVVGGLLTRRR